MDEIIMRRLRHLQQLEDSHAKDFEERFGTEQSRDAQRREAVSNAVSASWNRIWRATARAAHPGPLPKGWRKEHWKTLQAMAADFAGVEARNKSEAVTALEAYEAGLSEPAGDAAETGSV